MSNDFDYLKNDECECCWDYNRSHTKGKPRKEYYDMVMCNECLHRTKDIIKIVNK